MGKASFRSKRPQIENHTWDRLAIYAHYDIADTNEARAVGAISWSHVLNAPHSLVLSIQRDKGVCERELVSLFGYPCLLEKKAQPNRGYVDCSVLRRKRPGKGGLLVLRTRGWFFLVRCKRRGFSCIRRVSRNPRRLAAVELLGELLGEPRSTGFVS